MGELQRRLAIEPQLLPRFINMAAFTERFMVDIGTAVT